MVRFQPTEIIEPARIKPFLHALYGSGSVWILPLNPVTDKVVFNLRVGVCLGAGRLVRVMVSSRALRETSNSRRFSSTLAPPPGVDAANQHILRAIARTSAPPKEMSSSEGKRGRCARRSTPYACRRRRTPPRPHASRTGGRTPARSARRGARSQCESASEGGRGGRGLRTARRRA